MPCVVSTNDFNSVDDNSNLKKLALDPFTSPSAVPHYKPCLQLRPIHLHLFLDFDIASRKLIARVRHTLKAQTLNATTLTLNAEDFTVCQVTSPDDPLLQFSYDGHEIDIVFSKSIPKSQRVSLDISYVVEDPIDGLFFSRKYEGFFVVSDHETERARYWLPVVDHPTVRTTIDFDILTPIDEKLTVLANGEFVNETISEIETHKKITKWKMKQPTPSYILCVAIGQFVRLDVTSHKGKPVSFFAPKNARIEYTSEGLNATFGRTNEMLEFMENKVKIDLPWSKYYQWACGEVSGAMENSSLVSYDEWYLLNNRSMKERSHRVDSTVVHELAHTWFGNMVVCGDFCHSFLKESFATLISAEWYHFKNGFDDFQYTLLNYANTAFAETNEYLRPIVTRRYDSSWSLFDSHLYVNGAWRLHMLRVKLGNDQFWNAVSFYLKKRAWTTVETDDFRKDLEEFTGEELVSYFDQWFYSKGHPILNASFSYNPREGTSTVSLNQIQMNESKGISSFDITVEVALEIFDGKWETHKIEMMNGCSNGQVIVKTNKKPLQVVIDPNMNVLYSLNRLSGVNDDMSLRSLTSGTTVAARYQAVKQLREGGGTKRARRALSTALQSEKHWGMRILIAQALAKTGYNDIVDVMIDAMNNEKDARVIPILVACVCELRDVRPMDVENALLKFIEQNEDDENSASRCGYGALAAALRAIGKVGHDQKHIDLLECWIRNSNSEKKRKSFEMAQGAAIGLGLMRNWTATETLMKLITESQDGKWPARTRGALVRALGNAVMMEERCKRIQVFEFVVKLSKSADLPKGLRMACASTLTTLADGGNAIEALNGLEQKSENQSKVIIRNLKKRAIRNANANNRSSGSGGADSATAKAMTNTVERLQREMKELREKIDDLQTKLNAKASKDVDNQIAASKQKKKSDDNNAHNVGDNVAVVANTQAVKEDGNV